MDDFAMQNSRPSWRT